MARIRTFCYGDDEEAAALLFDVETYLRVVVRWESAGARGADWKSCIPAEMHTAIAERLRQEEELGYLDARPAAPLSYLSLSELKDIIVGPLWSDAFKLWGARELVVADFKKLIAVRNKIAHFRPVTTRDLRNASRFAEDLVEWTTHYRRIREAARPVDVSTVRHQDSGCIVEVAKWKQDAVNIDKFAKSGASLFRVGRFVALDIGVEVGSLPPKQFGLFLDKYKDRIAFVRLGKWAERLCCYVAQVIKPEEVVSIFDKCLALADSPVAKIASEQVRAEFDLPSRDYVVPRHLELPLDFRI